MVKKTSFLEKLKNRWRPASGMQVEDAPRITDPANRLQPIAQPDVEAVSSRKLNSKQEAVVAINEGFKELASLLRGMQSRVDGQGEQINSATDSLSQLPALQQSQIELMRVMAERLETQNSVTAELKDQLGDMPEMVGQLRESLDRAAATDERTAQTLGEFKANMAGIQDAMSRIVEHSGKQAEAATSLADGQREQQESQTDAVRGMVNEFEQAHQKTLGELRSSSEQSAKALRRAQSEQSDKISSMVEGSKRASKTVIALLGVGVGALVIIALLLAFK